MAGEDQIELEKDLPVEQTVEDSVDVQPAEPLSLRQTIENATQKAKEDKPETDNKEPKVRDRQADGKFAKKVATDEPTTATPKTVAPKTEEPPAHINNSYKPFWKDLPPAMREAISKREEDTHREITTRSEDRSVGQKFKEIVTPYVAQMRAEGAEPLQAIQSLLNTAYVLRTGSPAQKAQLLLETARQFGVDLRQAQQAQPQTHPALQQVMDRQAQLERQLRDEREFKTQQEQAGLNGQIEAFRASSGHEHFEAVKAHMAALLSNNLAKDLQDAYDQAVYARPDIRSTILGQQNAELEAKRVADKKAKAEAAKRAGSSLRGSPGMVAPANGRLAHPNLRDEIAANFRSHLDS